MAKPTAARRRSLDGGLRRERAQDLRPRRVAARRDAASGARLRRLDQGPLTTRSAAHPQLNVALRQELDLYVCLRPVQYFKGVPSPLKEPEKTNMVIFRENSEDIYAGIEYEAQSDKAKKLIKFLIDEMGVKKIRFPDTSGIGIKPVSIEGTERLVRKALQYAIDNDKPSVTLVHKGNIMKFTEGGFRDWGYALAQKEFGAELIDGGRGASSEPETGRDNHRQGQHRRCLPAADPAAPGRVFGDRHAQPQRRLRVRRAGGASGWHRHRAWSQPERQRGDVRGHHGRAQVRRKDYVNPGSEILSAEMMLRHMGWTEAAD